MKESFLIVGIGISTDFFIENSDQIAWKDTLSVGKKKKKFLSFLQGKKVTLTLLLDCPK